MKKIFFGAQVRKKINHAASKFQSLNSTGNTSARQSYSEFWFSCRTSWDPSESGVKEFSPTHTPVHAPLTFIANRDPKSTEIRPKIAFLQKFRLRNFGRGVSGAPPKFFLNYKYKLFSPKKFSWSSDF